jgi:hypothetical protein
MIKIAIGSSTFCVTAFAVAFMISEAFKTPDVFFSYSSNGCVKVNNYTTESTYSCENLPKKYNKMWVK